MSVRIHNPDPDLLRLRSEYAALRFERAMLKFELAIKDYRDQPRVPAGSSEGGRWTSGGGEGSGRGEDVDASADKLAANQSGTGWRTVSEARHPDGTVARRVVMGEGGVVIGSEFPPPGAGFDVRHTVRAADGAIRSFETTGHVQTIYDESGQAISQTVWTRNGPEAMDRIQPAYLLPLGPLAAEKTIAAAITLYGYYLTLQGGGKPALAYPARFYERSEKQAEPIFVGLLTDTQVNNACERYAKVQEFTDSAVKKLNRNDYLNAATYGTAVHMEVRDRIRAVNSGDFLAETSLMKTIDETGQRPDEGRYGKLGSIRIDALDNTRRGTACVYDIKTGKSGLLPGRSKEIAATVRRNFEDAYWIIVTEVRPAR